MKAKILAAFVCFIASTNLLANNPTSPSEMSSLKLQGAKPMRVLHGEWPPLPASLAKYNADCPGTEAPKAIVARLSSNEMLWGLCTSVKANNTNYTFFIVSESKTKRAKFAVPPGNKSLKGVLANPGISNEDRVLSSLTKGDGKSGCSTLGEWTWDGSQFQLLNYRVMHDCKTGPQ